MNTAITVLGLMGTFIVPFIVVLFQKYYENKDYKRINNERRKTLSGNWKGIFIGEPAEGSNSQEQDISGEIIAKNRKVKGEFKYNDHHIFCEGGFRNDRFLVLVYNNKTKLQFGAIILELKPTNEELLGKFMGFGHLSEKLVFGKVSLKKEK